MADNIRESPSESRDGDIDVIEKKDPEAFVYVDHATSNTSGSVKEASIGRDGYIDPETGGKLNDAREGRSF